MVQIINVPENCMADRFDWLVTFVYFLGDLLWVPAAASLILEAMNQGYKERCDASLLQLSSAATVWPPCHLHNIPASGAAW